MPAVCKGVKEIRISLDGQFRILYTISLDQKVLVLHAFEKKSQKTAKRDVDQAKRVLKATNNRWIE